MPRMEDPLFQPLQIGPLTLPNRIVMAPLTRCRASAGRVPNDLMARHYAARAGFGLILSEATSVTPMGVGYADTPGIWSDAQTDGWKRVTRAVHDAGGRIFLQLWHVGRISDPMFLDGAAPVSSSAVAAPGYVSRVRPKKAFVTPRALETEEIAGVIEDYRKAAANALIAGFDGVEIHGANGYLIDQFLQDGCNRRNDDYGGSIENRARFMMEVTDAVVSVWGADRVGMHIAPRGDAHGMGDSDPAALFDYVARELGRRRLAFICARESHDRPALGPSIRRAFGGVFIANEGFTSDSAREVIQVGDADAVAFGKPTIANADLVDRIRTGMPWNEPDVATFYDGGPKGYVE
jgi:2,4-dienoyl-CoA reductase-like NADH-dependent reductase (Old Yellow Enzyme family)